MTATDFEIRICGVVATNTELPITFQHFEIVYCVLIKDKIKLITRTYPSNYENVTAPTLRGGSLYSQNYLFRQRLLLAPPWFGMNDIR